MGFEESVEQINDPLVVRTTQSIRSNIGEDAAFDRNFRIQGIGVRDVSIS